jgi:glutaredoxin
LTSETLAILQGKQIHIAPKEIEPNTIVDFPLLVSANWCPFTSAAKDFWNEAAQAFGTTLTTVDAQSEEGAQVIISAGIAGVPCLVVAPDRLFYGLWYDASDAKSLLKGLAS